MLSPRNRTKYIQQQLTVGLISVLTCMLVRAAPWCRGVELGVLSADMLTADQGTACGGVPPKPAPDAAAGSSGLVEACAWLGGVEALEPLCGDAFCDELPDDDCCCCCAAAAAAAAARAEGEALWEGGEGNTPLELGLGSDAGETGTNRLGNDMVCADGWVGDASMRDPCTTACQD